MAAITEEYYRSLLGPYYSLQAKFRFDTFDSLPASVRTRIAHSNICINPAGLVKVTRNTYAIVDEPSLHRMIDTLERCRHERYERLLNGEETETLRRKTAAEAHIPRDHTDLFSPDL